MKRLIATFVLLICHGINAQVTQEVFESFRLQQKRNVSYYIPEDYSTDKKYPLVVVLDQIGRAHV